MIITAKFASMCPCCSIRIVAGSKVEWSKDSAARHVACAGSATTVVRSAPVASTRRAYAPRSVRTGCRCGSVEGEIRTTDCWTCKHDAA